MRLPNGDQAIVDERKLRDYCLNPQHPVGKHKARVFASALDLNVEDAPVLQRVLLDAAQTQDAVPGTRDQYGQRFTIDF